MTSKSPSDVKNEVAMKKKSEGPIHDGGLQIRNAESWIDRRAEAVNGIVEVYDLCKHCILHRSNPHSVASA